jgi:hypothetical protein
MRAVTLPIAIVLAAAAIAGCGGGGGDGGDRSDGGGGEPSATRTLKFDPPSKEGVSTTIRRYLNALNAGDAKRACRLLDERGKTLVIRFLPSRKLALGCEVAIRRVMRQAVPVRHFKVEKVSVSGRSATAKVEGTDPPYSSGVLLAYEDDRWKIAYPPGLQAKSGRPPPDAVPGVPLEQD